MPFGRLYPHPGPGTEGFSYVSYRHSHSKRDSAVLECLTSSTNHESKIAESYGISMAKNMVLFADFGRHQNRRCSFTLVSSNAAELVLGHSSSGNACQIFY